MQEDSKMEEIDTNMAEEEVIEKKPFALDMLLLVKSA